MLAQKQYKPAAYRTLDISQPGYGGLNIQDLEYELNINQSPDMLNMMLKNGAFGKRYGQEEVHEFTDDIKAMAKYKDCLYIHAGTDIIQYDADTDTETVIYSDADALAEKGVFFNFNKLLYYLNGTVYLQYDGTTMTEVEPYCPDLCINRKPDGSYADIIDDYNRLGAGFKNTFHGDGTSKTFVLTDQNLDARAVSADVDGNILTEGTDFTVDRTAGTVTFNTAPLHSTNNVVITAYKTEQEYIDSIMSNKYWAAYGGQNNSRLFLAGNGHSIYYFSDVFDASYFPESNYAAVGNGEDDITGFGAQYNVLVVFKPTEMYAISYNLVQNADGDTEAQFFSAQINVEMGCDMPATIHYVDNRLTWGSTEWGICTLCSTVIEDERNVRVISRNINGGERRSGLLDENELEKAIAINFEGKYILTVNGNAYVWDYTFSPYPASDRIAVDNAAKSLSWFFWQNINVSAYMTLKRKLYYARGAKLCTFNHAYSDFGAVIPSHYQTPLIDFGAYEYLKTIKKIFFEVRGDTPATTRIKYITEENPDGEVDPEDIFINTKLWKEFNWQTWGWSFVNFAKTFARKCSIKKVTFLSVRLENEEVDRDMSLSGIRMNYTMVKEIK